MPSSHKIFDLEFFQQSITHYVIWRNILRITGLVIAYNKDDILMNAMRRASSTEDRRFNQMYSVTFKIKIQKETNLFNAIWKSRIHHIVNSKLQETRMSASWQLWKAIK